MYEPYHDLLVLYDCCTNSTSHPMPRDVWPVDYAWKLSEGLCVTGSGTSMIHMINQNYCTVTWCWLMKRYWSSLVNVRTPKFSSIIFRCDYIACYVHLNCKMVMPMDVCSSLLSALWCLLAIVTEFGVDASSHDPGTPFRFEGRGQRGSVSHSRLDRFSVWEGS